MSGEFEARGEQPASEFGPHPARVFLRAIGSAISGGLMSIGFIYNPMAKLYHDEALAIAASEEGALDDQITAADHAGLTLLDNPARMAAKIAMWRDSGSQE